jgi:hypothetical protein
MAVVSKSWYGLTLVPRELKPESHDVEGAVEAIVRARQAKGWELVRVAERDNSEVLIFRRPA